MTEETTETETTSDNERMEQRVEKLLKQAEDFRRHGEDGSADAAMSLAEKIMLKHSIDAAVIAARLAAGQLPDNDEIITDVVTYSGIYRRALVTQFAKLVTVYTTTVQPFMSKYEQTERLHLVGFRSEVEQLKLLLTSLHLQVIGSISLWWNTSPIRGTLGPMASYKARRQFAFSWIDGATDRIARARRASVQEAVDSDPGTALALRTRADQVNDYVAANYNLRSVSTNLYGGDPRASIAGYAAGQQANTGETSVATDRRQLGT